MLKTLFDKIYPVIKKHDVTFFNYFFIFDVIYWKLPKGYKYHVGEPSYPIKYFFKVISYLGHNIYGSELLFSGVFIPLIFLGLYVITYHRSGRFTENKLWLIFKIFWLYFWCIYFLSHLVLHKTMPDIELFGVGTMLIMNSLCCIANFYCWLFDY